MELRKLSDQELTVSTERAVLREREATDQVIEHLCEVQRRRLFAKLGYSNMFLYCTQKLKYGKASAQLRIDAMKLANDVPEVKEALKSGAVTLSSVATIQRFIRNEKTVSKKSYTAPEKHELFKMSENRSQNEVEKMLAGISPRAVPVRETERVLTPTLTEVKFVASDELLGLTKQMKEKMDPRKYPNPTYAQVFEHALRLALGTFEKKVRNPEKKTQAESAAQLAPNTGSLSATQSALDSESVSQTQPAPVTQSAFGSAAEPAPSQRRPYIPVSVQREVRAKAQYRCTYVSPLTGKPCGESRDPQIEHKLPFAKGGSSRPENLTLHCPAHQRLRAIEEYGEDKMRPFLKF